MRPGSRRSSPAPTSPRLAGPCRLILSRLGVQSRPHGQGALPDWNSLDVGGQWGRCPFPATSPGAVAVCWAPAPAGCAPEDPITDRPPLPCGLYPARSWPTGRQALKLYAPGLFAAAQGPPAGGDPRTFEEAAQLDPEASSRPQGPDSPLPGPGPGRRRPPACRTILDLDPEDYEIWYLYACEPHERGTEEDAVAALRRAVAMPSPQGATRALLAQMYYDLGVLHEEAQDATGPSMPTSRCPGSLGSHGPPATSRRAEPSRKEPRRRSRGQGGRDLRTDGPGLPPGARSTDQAVAAFSEARKSGPDRAGRLNYNLAQVYLRQGPAGRSPGATWTHTCASAARRAPSRTSSRSPFSKSWAEGGRSCRLAAEVRRRATRRNVGLQLLLARQYGWPDRLAEAERRYKELAED